MLPSEEGAEGGVGEELSQGFSTPQDLNTPVISSVEDMSSDDDLQVVAEHLVPPDESHGVPVNLPVGLQAKLLAAVRASNVKIPNLASARIRIISKESTEGSSSGNCRIVMSQAERSRGAQPSISIPYNEFTQPSTSKGSRLAGGCPSPVSPELVDLVNTVDEAETSKKLSSADRTTLHTETLPANQEEGESEVALTTSPSRLNTSGFLAPQIPRDETAVDSETEEDSLSDVGAGGRNSTPDLDSSDLFNELAKVNENIANFGDYSDANDESFNNDMNDEFRSVSPGSKDDTSELELRNLMSEDESVKSIVHTSDLLQLHEGRLTLSLPPSPTSALLFPSPPPLNEDSCDIEEGQVVSLLETSSSDDEIFEIPQEQIIEEENRDKFVQQVTPLPWSVLSKLDIKIHETTPYLAVSTFEQLYDNFQLETLRLIKLMENQGFLVQNHLLFQGWEVTHVSFKVAHQIVELAGGEPSFLCSFLKRSCLQDTYINLKDFKNNSLIPQFPDEQLFTKTHLSECNDEEFKSIFGLVSHEEATEIKEKAKVVKRRLLRPDRKLDDFLNKKKKPEQVKLKENKWLLPKSKAKNSSDNLVEEPALVSGSLSQKLKDLSNNSNLNSVKKLLPKSPEKRRIKDAHIIPVELSEGSKMESFEVKQTREMKRKGIKMPRGWRVFGKRRVSEAKSEGNVYQYFRIEWQFRSPDGKNFRSLKRAMEEVKKHPRREKWETVKTKQGQSGKGPQVESATGRRSLSSQAGRKCAGPSYLTLKDQVEHELDLQLEKDVYSLSGIRPVRKFAEDLDIHSRPDKEGSGTSPPFSPPVIRMSGVTKPLITVAQYKAMMGRVPPHAVSNTIAGRKFSLANVGEIIGPLNEGWLSSKLSSLSKIPSAEIPGEIDETEVSYSVAGPLTETPLTSDGKVRVEIFTETENRLVMDIDVFRSKYYTGKIKENGSVAPSKKVVRNNLALPVGWVQKFDTPKRLKRREEVENTMQFVSPDGRVFHDLDKVVTFINFESNPKMSNLRKSLPGTPEKYRFRLAQSPICKKSSSLHNILGSKMPEINIKPLIIPTWSPSEDPASTPQRCAVSRKTASNSKRSISRNSLDPDEPKSESKSVSFGRSPVRKKRLMDKSSLIRSSSKRPKMIDLTGSPLPSSPVREVSPDIASSPDSLNDLLLDDSDEEGEKESSKKSELKGIRKVDLSNGRKVVTPGKTRRKLL